MTLSKNSDKLPNPRVVKFLSKEHIATFTLNFQDELWSWHAFYRYLPEKNLFITLSTSDSKHVNTLAKMKNPVVSGGVAINTKLVRRVRGVQFLATAAKCTDQQLSFYRAKFNERFPQALLYPKGEVWLFKLTYIKFTDNRFKFGEKLYWPL